MHFRGQIWKRVWKMTFLRSDIGLGFGERAGTPPLRIPRVPPSGWGFKLFVLRILRCNAPFLVPSFSGKKQPRPSAFWKARRHWGREWAEKMGWLYPSSVNSRRIIRLKRRIKSDELSVQIEQRPFLHLRWIIRLRRIIHLQNPSKLRETIWIKSGGFSMQN